MLHTRITEGPLAAYQSTNESAGDGAELVFFGRVRETERGSRILGLRYEYYPTMAEAELARLARQALEQFAISALRCDHRVGDVPIGDASLQVVIHSKHRAEALQAMAWFVSELKRSVPIWKWAIYPDGRVEPCGPCHGCSSDPEQRDDDEPHPDAHAAIGSP